MCRRGTAPGRRRTAGSCDAGGLAGGRASVARSRGVRPASIDVDMGPRRAAVELLDARGELVPPNPGVGDHAAQAGDLGPQRLDLAIDPGDAIERKGAPLGRVVGGLEEGLVAEPCHLVLEQLADLPETEARVVAEALDEPQAL